MHASRPSARSRRSRARLAVLAACVSTFVALTCHVAAGAALPALPGILVPLLLATVVSMWLSPIRAGWVRLALSVAASQFAFHALFMLGTPAGTASLSHHATHAEMAAQIARGSVHLAHSSPQMLWLHVVAAAVTCVALHFGETVLVRVREALGALLGFVWVRPRPALVPSARPALVAAARILPARVVNAAAPRRGPPALATRAPLSF